MTLRRDRSKEFRDLHVEPYGISRDSPWCHIAWQQALDLNFALLSDFNGDATRAFGVAHEFGDGYADVLYSTGNTGGPRVRVVGGATLTANPGRDAYYLPALADFFALDPADRTGLRIAAHDLNGDGRAELVVANGNTTSPEVRVLSLADMQSPTGPATPYLNPMPGSTVDGVYVG